MVNKEKKQCLNIESIAFPAVAAIFIVVNISLINVSIRRNPAGSKDNIEMVTSPVSTTFLSEKTSDDYVEYISQTLESTVEAVTVYNSKITDIPEIHTSYLKSEKSVLHTTAATVAETSVPYTEGDVISVDENVAINNETTVPEQEELQGELLPPVSAELQSLFEVAYNIYSAYTLGNSMFIDYDYKDNITIDGKLYYLTRSDYFMTIQDVEDYFHMYFTDDFISNNDVFSHFIEYNGRVYTETWGKCGIMGYAGHTYKIISMSNEEIVINVECYISLSDDYDGSLIFSVPDDISNYSVIEKTIVFKKENGEWRVDKVELMW